MSISRFSTALVLVFSLAGCDKENGMRDVSDIGKLYENLKFECAYEVDQLPVLMPESDQLYKYGLYLQLKHGSKNFDEIARYYRIAAAHAHYKASANLQAIVSRGQAFSPDSWVETLDLVEDLIRQGIPGGYYDMGRYLDRGFGVVQDPDKAKAYYRRAADLGSPDAQFYVAELLGRVIGPKDVMLQMYECAMAQGHGKAGLEAAMFRSVREQYSEALPAFQQAVKYGNASAARFLSGGFITTSPSEELRYMALAPDPERARRYKLIDEFLDRYENLGAKVPDIDQIVPLPPAKLPDWDETFQWKKDRDAAVPPSKPSDELMQRLSEEKGLDPATFQWKKDRDAAVPPSKPSDELMQRLSEEKGLDPATGLRLPKTA
ncbi:sel1 repeat family protein [Pseudomonas sp. Bc-h]|uniref:SEL1-like repeat protein n=1 Tax=Pseudomonas sp. Bc-h TaxID=1943632 RepID=UPI0015B4ABBA|nr:sel1 repeat family protein [Pseudomonas sp. Bc-h]